MAAAAFAAADFKVFDLAGLEPRMAEIRRRLRPKLEAMGHRLAPELARTLGREVFSHVAKHARRTVNPPDDTWVALASDPRGYKKHGHYKIAISAHCVRFLFEVGPEHADKKRWAAGWKKAVPQIGPVLRRVKGLAWFKNEHDETPAALLADVSLERLLLLGDELLRVRDGQLVLGRVAAAEKAAAWTEAEYRAAALQTFRALAPLSRL